MGLFYRNILYHLASRWLNSHVLVLSYPLTKPPFGGCAIYFPDGIYTLCIVGGWTNPLEEYESHFSIIFPKAPNSWSSKTNYTNIFWNNTTIRQKIISWLNQHRHCAPENPKKHVAHEIHQCAGSYYLGVSLNGGTPISHLKSWSFFVGKPMGLLGTTHHFRVHPPDLVSKLEARHLLRKYHRKYPSCAQHQFLQRRKQSQSASKNDEISAT